MGERIGISTIIRNLKDVRESLVKRNMFAGKVVPEQDVESKEKRFVVVTTLESGNVDTDDDSVRLSLLRTLNLLHLQEHVQLRIMPLQKAVVVPEIWKRFHSAIEDFIARHPPESYSTVHLDSNITSSPLQTAIPKEFKYDIYTPLLQLPSNTPIVTSEPWKTYLSLLQPPAKEEFYKMIAKIFKVTHIALKAPIPVKNNEIRKPLLIPLLGDFGEDFWVSTTQNTIYQTWQPMYTMFSRGNIKEKARVLEKARTEASRGYVAVDLYVGIGYFAFSYLKGGATKVLGWDINHKSIKGCEKGAEMNGWSVEQYHDDKIRDIKDVVRTKQLILFNESNIHAPLRIQKCKSLLLPIKFINLGLLPTSLPSYTLAAEIVLMNDPPEMVTVLVHENVGIENIAVKTKAIIERFQELLIELGKEEKKFQVECQHVEMVKSWAPKVFHCVFDIVLSPRTL